MLCLHCCFYIVKQCRSRHNSNNALMLAGTSPDGPANRNTPACPLLAVCVSVGDTNSNRLAGSFSSAEPATRERYCKSASGRWKSATPPAPQRWFQCAAAEQCACCCAECLECLENAGNKPYQENDLVQIQSRIKQVCAYRVFECNCFINLNCQQACLRCLARSPAGFQSNLSSKILIAQGPIVDLLCKRHAGMRQRQDNRCTARGSLRALHQLLFPEICCMVGHQVHAETKAASHRVVQHFQVSFEDSYVSRHCVQRSTG